jgi:hypothetical protein
MPTFEELRASFEEEMNKNLKEDEIIQFYTDERISRLDGQAQIGLKWNEIQILDKIKGFYMVEVKDIRHNFYSLQPGEGSGLPEIPAYLHFEILDAINSAVYEGPGTCEHLTPSYISTSRTSIIAHRNRQIIKDTYERFLKLLLLFEKLRQVGYVMTLN